MYQVKKQNTLFRNFTNYGLEYHSAMTLYKYLSQLGDLRQGWLDTRLFTSNPNTIEILR